jgi:RNA polymerase sigma-70 factor (ECF subfamily)
MTELASPIEEELDGPEDLGESETDDSGSADEPAAFDRDARSRARLRTLIDRHFNFVWRSVRRLGVPEAGVDDATQQVFWTAARKLDAIVPGREKSFLFGVAVRIASDARRVSNRQRRREGSAELEIFSHPDPLADELVDRKRMRALLDEFLDDLSIEVRTAYVLYEAEGMTVPEIADWIQVPPGTVASRIRLARKRLDQLVERLQSVGDRGEKA